MTDDKIRVYHFVSGGVGGVFSVTVNLIKYLSNPLIENHVIITADKNKHQQVFREIIPGASSQQIFYYSTDWNFYYISKKLSKLIFNNKAIIIANDYLELGMVSNLGLPNPVIQVLHGNYDYYFQLASSHHDVIDEYVAVAQSIQENLFRILPKRGDNIHYYRFPVGESNITIEKKQKDGVIFIGRCTSDKGYHLLPLIADELVKQSVHIQWKIVGELKQEDNEAYPWQSGTDVCFYGVLENKHVFNLLDESSIYILPSLAEGMPVSLIESMKSGVIPVVNDLQGGIQELVYNGRTGYKIKNNLIAEYAEAIKTIINNETAAAMMRMECKFLSNTLFNPVENIKNFEALYLRLASKSVRDKPVSEIYRSRLDKPWLPNWLVNCIRKYFARPFKIFICLS
jgi:glycosyltransferase involved in cell wall biosynthesis